MNNRLLFSLTGVVIVGMLILLALNMTATLTGHPPRETYLKYNQIRGIEVGHNNLLYTLNFKQQNTLVKILNRSVKVVGLKPGKHQKPAIDKIIVYRFGLPDLVITPIAYIDDNLVFTVPEWDANGYLMELSDGNLRKLISQTYDP